MVHLYENFQCLGMWCDPKIKGITEEHKKMVKHISATCACMEEHLGIKPSIRFQGFQQKPVVAWLLQAGMTRDAPTPFSDDKHQSYTTPFYDGQRVPHIELGGINGCDAISIRSLTHLDEEVRDKFDRAWFKINYPNGKPEDLPEPAEQWMESENGISLAVGEFIANSMQWGKTKK